ncbi:hypothetical protein [Alcaligenes sp. Marseille-Q7550]
MLAIAKHMMGKGMPLWATTLLFLCAAILNLAIFYPGIVTPDSLSQLAQADSNTYSDWHPALMAWLWRLSNFVVPDHAGLLVLHLAVFWSTLFYLSRLNPGQSPLWYLGLGLLPFILGISGVIWKDVGTAYFLLLSAALLHRRGHAPAATFWLCAFVAVGYRYNTALSIFPLLYLYFHQRFQRMRWPALLVASAVAMAAVYAAVQAFNSGILNTRKDNPSVVILVDDLTHLSVARQESLIPGLSLTQLQDSYKASINDNYFRLHDKGEPPLSFESIQAAWRHAIQKHPWDYLSFRLKAYARFMGISLPAPFDLNKPSYSYWEPYSYESTKTNRLRILVGKYVTRIAKTLPFLFTGWFWLLAASLLLIQSWRLRSRENAGLAAVLCLSAMINLFSYLLVANAPYFRYFYWSILACCMAGLLLARQSSGPAR